MRAERSGPGGISGTRRFGRVGRDGRGRKGVRAGSLGRGGNGGRCACRNGVGQRDVRARRSGSAGISGTRRFGRLRDRYRPFWPPLRAAPRRLRAVPCALCRRLGPLAASGLSLPPGPLPAFLAAASGRPSPPPGRSLRPLPPPRTSCRLGPLAAAGAVTGLPGRRFGPPPGDGVRGSVRRAARQATSRRVSAPRRQAPHR